ncbi:1-aminocyclopropane-1-carboxylate deaminase/D-cysteine desulfhydrase [Vibrio profundum]|uniref:1-aminocyclopropane-1-carboxylate deaminase/D-cysteine desulfhydrase n=1 Tax=Vibrio profundum TaxID=2910247 RepID=UPI003D110EAF
MKIANSPTTQHRFNDFTFFLKRDDLLHHHFSGNKARKFMSLLDQRNSNITTLVSYGSAQANSLYSLAALAQLKGWQLEYYVDRIPEWLKQNPIGNYQAALELGANIITVSEHAHGVHPKDYILKHCQLSDQHQFVPEGGYSQQAELGVRELAEEIQTWAKQQSIPKLTVALPSGTGATAAFLRKHLNNDIELITCACVGGSDYLKEQFTELLGKHAAQPKVLQLDSKHHFGKLYRQDFEVWQQLLEETEVEFDLLYDPMMWQCLQTWWPSNTDRTLLYIHQGGVLGNQSMLARYQRKFKTHS